LRCGNYKVLLRKGVEKLLSNQKLLPTNQINFSAPAIYFRLHRLQEREISSDEENNKANDNSRIDRSNCIGGSDQCLSDATQIWQDTQ
jgi:hypothetical protein